MKNLTERQREVLDAIRTYRSDRGYIPSIRELGRMLGISSLRGVTIHLDALEKKGWIKRERTSRSISVLAPLAPGPESTPARAVPLLGTIAAGLPLLAVENVESYIPLPPELAERTGEMFALKVKGDSMIGDHILDGDVIVVQSQATANNGAIVAAIIGDEATVKRLDSRSKPPRLLASNPNYEPIELAGEDARILGQIVGLVRAFKSA